MTSPASGVDDRFRLPGPAVPTAYRLALDPDLDRARFSGRVEIDVNLVVPSDELVLNAVDLDLESVDVVAADGSTSTPTIECDADLERLVLGFDRTLSGRVTIRCSYAGSLSGRLFGFYLSSFAGEDGEVRQLASTQLCTTYARRTFPCFDEPTYKATYELSVVVPVGCIALSNSAVAREHPLGDGRREVVFKPTIQLSTYLVAVVVGPLERSDVVDVDGVELSVVCTPGNRHLTRFALAVGAFALRFFGEYFGIPFPGEKIDLVGVPDFAYGAMENFGCITFRETALLIDEAAAGIEDLQRIAHVVSHELAHMWFGDLVTMAWWEGIWLNEAFATFLEHVCVDAFRPDWQIWERFHEQCEPGMEIDALHSTRAIEYPVHSPADAMGMLDAITYLKGSSVLRMLEQFLGESTFRDGIRRYLRAHAYANTETSDLWRALEAASSEQVGAIMDSWILQGGHPIVEVRGGECSQAPFTCGHAREPSNIGAAWRVPISARSIEAGEEASIILDRAPEPVPLPPPFVCNTGFGFYRTSYDASTFEALCGAIERLSGLERAVFVSDTWALVRAGRATLADFFALARRLGDTVEPSPWQTVEQALSVLDRIVDDEQRPNLERCARELAGPLHERLGWTRTPGEGADATVLRPLAIRVLGCLGHDESVRRDAAARFDEGEGQGDVADAVVAVVASMARTGDREELLRRMDAASNPQQATRYRVGIGQLADEEAGLVTFRTCFERFRLQDVPKQIQLLVQNRVTGPAVWTALSEAWDATVARIPPMMQSMPATGVSALIGDAAFADRVEAFHHDHPLPVGQQRVVQALERMRTGVEFAERLRPTLGDVLR